ncbi:MULTISPECIES: hypothetical protein [unclassified Micromonospora]|uniref:hypothetical protein n=1 Tax=unclassified Micromonospora TaxID=2617518 RepID=UPI001C224A88|nr:MULTISPECIES: hypothetical protein [unclassified Micromonospora]MBU8861088.1 hypothetical protein [Micromonospora sp. WMMB482]MDM4780635.1 hypothetical protein [Micromonospora sp. b486]
MSEASTDRVADRPAEVTDPLLWDLAAAVADAHQPDAERACASPSCAGAAWPCPAWNNAQAGLSAARALRPATAARSVPAARSAGPGGGITAVGVLTPGLAGTVPVAPADRQHGQPGAGDAAERLAAA